MKILSQILPQINWKYCHKSHLNDISSCHVQAHVAHLQRNIFSDCSEYHILEYFPNITKISPEFCPNIMNNQTLAQYCKNKIWTYHGSQTRWRKIWNIKNPRKCLYQIFKYHWKSFYRIIAELFLSPVNVLPMSHLNNSIEVV